MDSETWVLVVRNEEWRPVYPQGMRVSVHPSLVECVCELIERYGDETIEAHNTAALAMLGHAMAENWPDLLRSINEWVDPDEWSIYCDGRGYVDTWAADTEVPL